MYRALRSLGIAGVILATATLAACATTEKPAVAKTSVAKPAAVEKPSERLLRTAREESSAGRLVAASELLERALEIEPENPRLWGELASVRLREGRYADAETLARRSNSHARADFALRKQNWRVIALAREKRGDVEGAASAYELAQRIALDDAD